MGELKSDYLLSAKDMLKNAKLNLCHSVSAFNMCGVNFDNTVGEIKKTIGDIECAIYTIDEFIDGK